MACLENLLEHVNADDVYRAKGVVVLHGGSTVIFNYVYGRYTIETVVTYKGCDSKLVFMGRELDRHRVTFAKILNISAESFH